VSVFGGKPGEDGTNPPKPQRVPPLPPGNSRNGWGEGSLLSDFQSIGQEKKKTKRNCLEIRWASISKKGEKLGVIKNKEKEKALKNPLKEGSIKHCLKDG